jgi:hypothetical protein
MGSSPGRGQDAGDQRGQRDQAGGEEQRAAIEADVAEPRNALRCGAHGERHAGPRQHDPQRAADAGQDQGLRHEAPDQSAAAGAESGADGQLPLTALGLYEQQVRDVGARDEQDDPHRAEQYPQRRREVADQLLLQRAHHGSVRLEDARVRRRTTERIQVSSIRPPREVVSCLQEGRARHGHSGGQHG